MIKALLTEERGVSIECERSDAWFSGKSKSTPQRSDRLPPLKTPLEGVDEELTSKSGEILDSNKCPLLPQLEMNIQTNELSIGDFV